MRDAEQHELSHDNRTTSLSRRDFDLVVFDLDGVITRTADVHASAWKTVFDDFLLAYSSRKERPFVPFNILDDYREYVDGKPRYEGVSSFLQARDIHLPWGSPSDPNDSETVCGLGNRKNRAFLQALSSEGVTVFPSSLELIRHLRNAGFKTGVVSSSRNCGEVLKAAAIEELFDVRVDGLDLDDPDMKGKPEPDMFVEACHRLSQSTARAVGIEDATAGVKAIRSAGYGLVIGVARHDDKQSLKNNGADLVISDLGELSVVEDGENAVTAGEHLPSALDFLDRIVQRPHREPVFFLDYDGTLSPIVSHPDDAILTKSMKESLRKLSKQFIVAIITGRDLDDIRPRAGLENLWYAGSHGFDIAGPSGDVEHRQGEDFLPVLDEVEERLRERLSAVSGCLVERKRFSIATHYRQVAVDQVDNVKQTVEELAARHPELRMTSGKKVFELQPDIDCNKGTALRWLMDTLELDLSQYFPIYIGDDVTDEDAFLQLQDNGVGILVATHPQTTAAQYRLDGPAEVQIFLNESLKAFAGAGNE